MKPPLRILHYLGGDLHGGAAIAIMALHNAQLQLGLDSRILVENEPQRDSERIISLRNSPLRRLQFGLTRRLFSGVRQFENGGQVLFSSCRHGASTIDLADRYRCDIQHYQWIGNSFIKLKSLPRNQPVVITLRDMWWLTGGCHYSLRCSQYRSGCRVCALRSDKRGWSDPKSEQTSKREFLLRSNVSVVAISEWLADQFANSHVGEGIPVRVIPNCVDVEKFYPDAAPLDEKISRYLPKNKWILCGAQQLSDNYKGVDDAARLSHEMPAEFRFVVFGNADELMRASFRPDTVFLGRIVSTTQLRRLYSRAALLLVPSRQEAFGKVIVEAILCGCPVAARRGTGAGDVTASLGGILLPDVYSKEWALIVCAALEKESSSMYLPKREEIEALYSPQAAAQNYKNLYEAIAMNAGENI